MVCGYCLVVGGEDVLFVRNNICGCDERGLRVWFGVFVGMMCDVCIWLFYMLMVDKYW